MSYFSQKFIVVVLLILSLVGQSSASIIMPCDMMNMTDMTMPQTMTMTMTTSEHELHMTMNDQPTTSTTDDCCQNNCDCAKACGHSNYFTNQIIALTISPIPSEISVLHITLPQEQFLNYLFKPPIS